MKIFLAFYFAFDFCVSVLPIAFFAWRAWDNRNSYLVAGGDWSVMFFLAGYLLVTSVAGIVLSKKKNLDDENLTVSKNWLLPIYIVNFLGAFCLMFPFAVAGDFLFKKQFDVFAIAGLILVCEFLILRGQVKWERAVLCQKTLPRLLKYFVCIANPLRTGATMLFLIALILPI